MHTCVKTLNYCFENLPFDDDETRFLSRSNVSVYLGISIGMRILRSVDKCFIRFVTVRCGHIIYLINSFI